MKCRLMALLVCLTSTVMHASTVSCTADTLSAYLASASVCQVGSLIFGNFYYLGIDLGTGTALTADQIMVTPVTTASGPGLEFSGNWTGSDNGGSDSEIGYHVGSASGMATITETSLSMTASFTGTGDARAIEYLCPGGLFTDLCANSANTLQLLVDMQANPLPGVSSVDFPAVSNMSVLKDVRVYGAGTGLASMTSVTNAYETPEPVTPSLCFAGLLVIWGLRKRAV